MWIWKLVDGVKLSSDIIVILLCRLVGSWLYVNGIMFVLNE